MSVTTAWRGENRPCERQPETDATRGRAVGRAQSDLLAAGACDPAHRSIFSYIVPSFS